MDSYKLSDEVFSSISRLMEENIGLHLTSKKKAMVNSRLAKRLRELKLESFDQYCDYLSNNNDEVVRLANLLTTNVTNFFREDYHFQFLKKEVLPEIRSHNRDKKIRLWSAGCSSGQEPYSLAITLNEFFDKKWDIKILATDINTDVLKHARQGIYYQNDLKSIPYKLLTKYFKLGEVNGKKAFKVKKELQKLVVFKKLNFKQRKPYPIKSKLDFIFCRNVFIYFKKETRNKILNRFYGHLKDNGYLFLGHSESISSLDKISKKWELLEKTTYRKK